MDTQLDPSGDSSPSLAPTELESDSLSQDSLLALLDNDPPSLEEQQRQRERQDAVVARFLQTRLQYEQEQQEHQRRQREQPECLSAQWERVADEVHSSGHPIIMKFTELYDIRDELTALSYAADAFYVGATTDPIWRWEGGPSDRGRGEYMEGHSEQWQELNVLHISWGVEAVEIETSLIKQVIDHDNCKNKASDSRGLVKSKPNFIYVAVRY